MNRPPFKLALAATLLDGPMSGKALSAKLRGRYAESALYGEKNVDAALQSLRAVVIVKSETADGGECFSLTEYGRQKVLKSL